MDITDSFNKNWKCNKCGTFGAIDFYGDLLCKVCYKRLTTLPDGDDDINYEGGVISE